jgi:hypothetical protein
VSPVFVLHVIALPDLVTPRAPTGAQNAPAVTVFVRTDGVDADGASAFGFVRTDGADAFGFVRTDGADADGADGADADGADGDGADGDGADGDGAAGDGADGADADGADGDGAQPARVSMSRAAKVIALGMGRDATDQPGEVRCTGISTHSRQLSPPRHTATTCPRQRHRPRQPT